ncbi:MAG: family 16 glycosylhydrolase [Spirochaetales bacterium]|nr:family 16 glycosylhydrolase [Spirochaetales bacterium]
MKLKDKIFITALLIVLFSFLVGCVSTVEPGEGPPENLALNKETDRSSIENGGLESEMAVDGDMETRWSSEFNDPNWISVDLGAKYQIKQVVCRWEVACGEDYRIEISDNNSSWKTVFERKGFEGGDDIITFSDTIAARYVRVYGETRGTPYGYSLWELEIWDKQAFEPTEAVVESKPMENRDLWELVWSDEFDGPEIDRKNWVNETGGHGWGNGELQNYTKNPENSSIAKDADGNSVLLIQALKETKNGKTGYTSARMKTQGLQSWKYGKVEARIKMPYSQGLWPAFWMLGDKFSSVGWPGCGEIDIVEMIGGASPRDSVAMGTLHYKDAGGGHSHRGGIKKVTGEKLADNYHVYGIEWTEESLKWFLDGEQYHVEDITADDMSEFHDKFFIILNCAVGGGWPGSPDDSSVFPQKMYIDYVRVLKMK